MAAILVIFGSSAGFLAALAHVAVFGGSILTGLAIWSGLGVAITLIAVLLALLPHGAQRTPVIAQEA
jgi:hypothetical protein